MQISILGCGWLGLPLAQSFINTGFTVNGSTTSPSKIKQLSAVHINPFLIALNSDTVDGDIKAFLQGSDILIINIPPKARSENNGSFIPKIKMLIPYIETSGVTKVIFTSSIAVYANDNAVVTEYTPANPETENGKQLLKAEQLLQGNVYFKTTVLHFGGLIGEDRQPVKYLAGKENLENPDSPVNLIHQKDCIGIMLKVVEKNIWGEIFNAVAPYHPSREAHYTKEAVAMNLPLPKFSHKKPSLGKTVISEKVSTVLGYTFK